MSKTQASHPGRYSGSRLPKLLPIKAPLFQGRLHLLEYQVTFERAVVQVEHVKGTSRLCALCYGYPLFSLLPLEAFMLINLRIFLHSGVPDAMADMHAR